MNFCNRVLQIKIPSKRRVSGDAQKLGLLQLGVLSGIYALERIAQDSKKDHWPIMEILTAYVRENAQWKGDDLINDN